MGARVLAGVLATAALAVAPLEQGAASPAGSRHALAVLPCTDIEATFRKFHPLLAYLKSATGLTVTLVVPADFAEFEATTTAGEVDFALQDPHTYRQLSRLFDDASLLQARAPGGTTTQSGVVIVRRDSGVTDLTQLRRGAVMFGPRTSSAKWVAAQLLFESRGIHVERDLKRVHGGCCEDIAFAVSVKAVDAGVVCDHFLDQHRARQKDLGVNPGSLVVVGRTAPVPTRIFAARKGVPSAIIAAIARSLLQLDPANPGHVAALSSAEIGGFFRTTEAAYLQGLIRPAAPGRP